MIKCNLPIVIFYYYPIVLSLNKVIRKIILIKIIGNFLVNDFWTRPPGPPPSYQLCTWSV